MASPGRPLPALPMLTLVPITLRDANAFVVRFHRHHKPVIGQKFSVGLSNNSNLCGVAITSRPTARMSNDGFTLEVTRLCTDGTANACSMLYRACWRCAREMGYTRLLTYTLPEESGISLTAAGFLCLGKAGGGSWNRPNLTNRVREDNHPLQEKLKWEIRRQNER